MSVSSAALYIPPKKTHFYKEHNTWLLWQIGSPLYHWLVSHASIWLYSLCYLWQFWTVAFAHTIQWRGCRGIMTGDGFCEAGHVCVFMGIYGDRPNHSQDAEAQWHLWFVPLGERTHVIAQLHRARICLELRCVPPQDRPLMKCTHIPIHVGFGHALTWADIQSPLNFFCPSVLYIWDCTYFFLPMTWAMTLNKAHLLEHLAHVLVALICALMKKTLQVYSTSTINCPLYYCVLPRKRSPAVFVSHAARCRRVRFARLHHPLIHGPSLWAEGILGLREGVWRAGSTYDDEGRRGRVGLRRGGPTGTARLSLRLSVQLAGCAVLRPKWAEPGPCPEPNPDRKAPSDNPNLVLIRP